MNPKAPPGHYSPRQWQIIILVAVDDLTYREIAARLDIHISTLRVHVARIVMRSGLDLTPRKAIHQLFHDTANGV